MGKSIALNGQSYAVAGVMPRGFRVPLLENELGTPMAMNAADQSNYHSHFLIVLARLKSGGLLITDNVLWSGKVAKPAKDRDTRSILEFNKMVYASKELFPVIVPLRDGVSVCRKA